MKPAVVTVMGVVLWTAAVVLHTSESATTTAGQQEAFTCSKPSSTGCGFTIDLSPTVHVYNFSEQEKAGTCKRGSIKYGNTKPVNLPNAISASSGQVTCTQAACTTCVKDKKLAKDSCCGTRNTFTYLTQTYTYWDQTSKKPTCCVAEGTGSSACYCEAATKDCIVTVQECTCVDKACQTCTQNKKLADKPGCCGTTQTFTYNNSTYTFWDDSSKQPTCCRAQGLNAKGEATTSCYCEPTTTACFIQKLCPAPPTSPSGRIIGGTTVAKPCGTQTLKIAASSTGGDVVLCNAIYAYNPAGKDGAGAALTKPVVIAPKGCTDAADTILKTKAKVQVTVGTSTFPYNKAEITITQLENKNFEALTFTKYTGTCMDKPVCTYNKATMASQINKTDCYLLSYGSDQISNGKPAYSGNLNKLSVHQFGADLGCPDDKKTPADCFFPTPNTAYTCQGDLGAPVFCSLKESGEQVLYGSFGQTGACGVNQKVFPVIPIS